MEGDGAFVQALDVGGHLQLPPVVGASEHGHAHGEHLGFKGKGALVDFAEQGVGALLKESRELWIGVGLCHTG